MKRTMINMAMAGIMAGIMTTAAWAGNAGVDRTHRRARGATAYMMTIPAGDLSEAESDTMLHMRQEEKLARDVYTVLFEVWDHWAFDKISQSEQRHMESLLALMEKYGVADPVPEDTTGVFADAEFTALYDEKVSGGSTSLVEALRVGATIEELDIVDLRNAIAETDDKDILIVYQNLMKGSRNHLRTFVYQLAAQGEIYEPQLLSPEDFEAIVSSPMERGFVDEDGNPVFRGRDRRNGAGVGSGSGPMVTSPDTALEDPSGDTSALISGDARSLLARSGKGRGGHGPGDGSGNGGNGPKDGSGNGRRTGACINA
ncbi:MAG: DUF2202 domain-containing protein [Deltaproteobacteria bacterium]|nr:DUF2202 domain-containing protein [Deltaproteobacteria bacterium]